MDAVGRARSARQGHSGEAGIIRGDEHVKFPALPCDHHPASGHALPDLPPHRRVPAWEPQRGPNRALPPGPPRSARPPCPVADRRTPQHRPQMPPRACPTRDEPAAGLDQRTPAVTERGRSMPMARAQCRRCGRDLRWSARRLNCVPNGYSACWRGKGRGWLVPSRFTHGPPSGLCPACVRHPCCLW
jgi:hypothetical protein